MSGRLRLSVQALGAGMLALAAAGCEKAMQDMYHQPRYNPFQSSTLFPDGSSARLPVDGSLAVRGGALAEASGGRRGIPALVPGDTAMVMPLLTAAASASGPMARFGLSGPRDIPLPLDRETFRRGQERYDIFCAPCHSRVGDGDGMVVRRGFPAPPSYHTDRLRRAPDRHFYDVISQGYGVMYAYADRLSPHDRWAVVAYIRALQLSQHAPVQALAETDRQQLAAAGDGDD